MRKKDAIAEKLKELWKDEFPDKPYVISSELILGYSSLFTIQAATLRSKYHIKSIIKVDSDIPYYCSFGRIAINVLTSIEFNEDQTTHETSSPVDEWGIQEQSDRGIIQYSPGSKERTVWAITNRTGIFKITMTDDTFFYYANWEVGYGKSATSESIALIDMQSVSKILKLNNKAQHFISKPKIGQFDLNMTKFGVSYTPIKFPGNITNIIHPHVETVFSDIEIHFNRLEQRKYHDRAILLYSGVGTGKTEFIKNLAEKYKNTHCIVYCRNVEAMFSHQVLAAKYNVPTIVIFEEFEEGIAAYNTGSDYNRVNSSIKNMLSGAYESINKKGCYIIYTTNYPERIDPSILHRKQRIDKMIHWGPLEGTFAVDCAKMYLGDDLYNELLPPTGHSGTSGYGLTLEIVFNKLPGVEIKSICEEAMAHCEANEKKVTLPILESFRKNQFSDLKEVYEFAELRDDGFVKIATKERAQVKGYGK